jgi:hypothetical protein
LVLVSALPFLTLAICILSSKWDLSILNAEWYTNAYVQINLWNMVLYMKTYMFLCTETTGIPSHGIPSQPHNHVGVLCDGAITQPNRHQTPCPCNGHQPQKILMSLAWFTKVKHKFQRICQVCFTIHISPDLFQI